jgi:hypothetical protein
MQKALSEVRTYDLLDGRNKVTVVLQREEKTL